LRWTKVKVDNGAAFLITQLFFVNAHYFEFVKRAPAAGVRVPIIPGIMPITNVAQVDRFIKLCGASIPPELRAPRPTKAPANGAHLAALVQRGLGSDLATAVEALEKELIETGLRETRGNRSRLAERLGVSRTTLIKKIREYGIAE